MSGNMVKSVLGFRTRSHLSFQVHHPNHPMGWDYSIPYAEDHRDEHMLKYREQDSSQYSTEHTEQVRSSCSGGDDCGILRAAADLKGSSL